jgi:hypothetical protein
MEGCGWYCLKAVANVGLWMELSEGSGHAGLWMELSEGSDQWRAVDGTV